MTDYTRVCFPSPLGLILTTPPMELAEDDVPDTILMKTCYNNCVIFCSLLMNTRKLPLGISCHVLTRIPILPREVRRSMQCLLQTCMSVMSWKLKYNQHCSWTVNLQMLPLPKINLTSNSSLPWAVIHLLGTDSYQVSKALPDTLQ